VKILNQLQVQVDRSGATDNCVCRARRHKTVVDLEARWSASTRTALWPATDSFTTP
jgi:hypothetical protein